jgi:hypothetical protein
VVSAVLNNFHFQNAGVRISYGCEVNDEVVRIKPGETYSSIQKLRFIHCLKRVYKTINLASICRF